MNITEFLLARIAEDEALANAADSGRWLPEDKGVTFEFYGDKFPDGEAQSRLTADTKANMCHIARHDPARVLAECAAKRAIIEEHGNMEVASLDRATRGQVHVVCRRCADGQRQVVSPCPTLKITAAVYKDHPDYQQEWAL